jgi:hypothetical protein
MPGYPVSQGDKSIMGPVCLPTVDHEAQLIKVQVGPFKISLNEFMIIDRQVRAARVQAAFADAITFDGDAFPL